MQYKGIELKDIADTPQIVNPPRDMIVWDDNPKNPGRPFSEPLMVKVIAIVNSDKLNGKVIAETPSSVIRYGHCAEIPKKLKPRRATNREVAKWLAKGNGEWCNCIGDSSRAAIEWWYDQGHSETKANNVFVRKWDDIEWHEPTLEYMGLEG